MTTRSTLFTRPISGLKEWIVALQRRLFFSEDWPGESKREFKDPYKDMDAMHDREMERLVKAIERMKSGSNAHYQ